VDPGKVATACRALSAGLASSSREPCTPRCSPSLDWLPTFVEIAGGPTGNGLKAQIEKGAYPGIVKTTLDGVNQIDYLTGNPDKSAREVFYYFSGATLSAVIALRVVVNFAITLTLGQNV
jgi:hypothetical protein